MNRVGMILLIAMAVIGGWFLFQGGQADRLADVFSARPPVPGMEAESAMRNNLSNQSQTIPIADFFPRDLRYIRVASFNVELRERSKGEDQDVMRNIAAVIAQFDIVALQDVAPDQHHLIGTVVDLINATGRHYDYVLGPRVGRDTVEHFAYVFDLRRVDVDRHELYTIEDPDDLVNNEPFVAWFRCKGPNVDEAFTFTLVNVHTDAMERDRENGILASVFRAVRNDQRGEDDVILLGDFQADAASLQQAISIPASRLAVMDIATDTRAENQFSNLLCSQQSTDEYTGRSGVLDFLREMNLSLDQALQVSSHLPVWAEFDMREGGRNNLAEKETSKLSR